MRRNGNTATQTRDRLAALRERKVSARDDMARARQGIEQARAAGDDTLVAEGERQFQEAHAELDTLNALENAELRRLVGDRPDFGAALRENVEARQRLEQIAETASPLGGTQLIGPLMSMEQACNLFGSALRAAEFFAAPLDIGDGPSRSSYDPGIAVPPQPGRTILDFWPSKPLESKTTDFLVRSPAASGSPALTGVDPTAEGALKPEIGVDYTDATASAEVYAGWVKVLRPQVDDVDGLMEDVQSVIRDSVLKGFERTLINGNVPFAQDGIKSVTGSLAPDLSTATNLGDAAALMIEAMTSTGVVPRFLAVNPKTYTTELLRKSSQGEYLNLIKNGTIWDVPLLQSVGLADDEIVGGDPQASGYVGVRQPPVLLVGTDSDDLTHNRLTALVEARLTPVIKVPAQLAFGTIGS